ncbi:pantetheine-phosphate adenylyltransferase [Sphingomonas nostoxanthinifaciens]|uniref:pantetheine-phosphate adenylyltransferase n=1 Tax=Sphingomonas nostoxanthinifaciens TaxID=2872652 RepID=UPI001CC1F107|nr:pantetheine-phosphate adenylyltransferase [Sphingomonas nostoxanthinifaciens]UAK24014.1 pantetheine-phosphate adenylyltransferase [Sphingomonas nostoxanthinifaciens]
MSRTAVYTGTFDPLTLGHLDIIHRAARLADALVIGVSTQSGKAPLFGLDQRVAMVAREVADLAHVSVRPFDGLAVDFARACDAQFIVRGLRSGSDLDYESPMAAMNHVMTPDIDTVFLVADPGYGHIASSLVKDVARGGGPIDRFVPPHVAAEIRALTL